MKKFTRFLGILAVVVGLGFSLSSCNMDKMGYKIEYYVITQNTYYYLQDRLSTSTPEELLNYVKNLQNSKKQTYWCSSENGVRDFLTEKLTTIYNLEELIDFINSRSTSCIIADQLFGDDYFFYIKNNEF